MSDDTITHRDLSQLLGISETTVKSYRRKFPDCIPVANNGKPIRFTLQAKDICFMIRDLFSTGMSVKEVRIRLEEEFPFILKNSKAKKKAAGENKDKPLPFMTNMDSKDATDHMLANMNTLIKSIVSLQQQQLSMQKSLSKIENAIFGSDCKLNIDFSSVKGSTNDNIEKIDALQNSVFILDETSQNLADLGKQLFNAFEETANMQRNWAAGAIALERSIKRGLHQENTSNEPQQAGRSMEEEPDQSSESVHGKIIPINRGEGIPQQASGTFETTPPASPPRSMLGLPLVVRGPEGTYTSAGGSRGKVSLNDLKAILAQAFSPPFDYSMHWKYSRDGWWVIIEQAKQKEPDSNPSADTNSATSFHMLVAEKTSSRGISALEIVQLLENGKITHPIEICSFISAI